MTERLRVALVGPGWIGRRHLGVLATEPGVELVGIVGREIAAAERAALEFGGRPYDDIGRLLEAERVEAAIICIPPDGHGALETAFLDRGVHLLIEKPLAADGATPERVGEAIRAAGVIAGAAYHWRAMDTIPESSRRWPLGRPACSSPPGTTRCRQPPGGVTRRAVVGRSWSRQRTSWISRACLRVRPSRSPRPPTTTLTHRCPA